ncbi:unnamed protein product [Phytomonas sp. Hart1]|nr:unnamed protein product [Phytomonas sp. Hart1]|eukprot:CCW70318.1 unnamed protein product [Phytomonas sp. isolate Hart1]
MQVRHCKTLAQGQSAMARTRAIAWSPNSKRLAVADSGGFVQLYDEQCERRDKFPTKSADGKGGRTYHVSSLAFSPESARIAVAQSDRIVFVYRIGLDWGDKKAITSKFPQTSPVTCVVWPSVTSQGVELIVFGTQEGKVKVGILKSNKSQSLYGHDHPVVALATSQDGANLVAGHLDGAVYVYAFDTDDGVEAAKPKRLFTHACAPYVLSWGEHICAAGQDGVMNFYSSISGQKHQSFDYPVKSEGGFTAGCCSPSRQTMVAASRDRLRVFNYNLRAGKWDEGGVVEYPNSYAVYAMGWKSDGSRLVVGTLTGAVDAFDVCLKRYCLRGSFEFTYVSHNQVIVKRLTTGARIVFRSNMENEIQRVNVHRDRYLVAYTSATLLVGDLNTCALSEVPWRFTGRETYSFDNPKVCMVFTTGELCLIEYGQNTLLGTYRTTERNAHRISVRLPDPAPGATRAIAYLPDRQTLHVHEVGSGALLARLTHPVRVDWLALSPRATRLLFRDRDRHLHLLDLRSHRRVTLLAGCGYAQWVPGSDVVVAQARGGLCVWYAVEAPERVVNLPIRGEVQGIARGAGKTEVLVDDGVHTVAYALDEAMIEFGAAMEEHDYERAVDLLDRTPSSAETAAMCTTLAGVALAESKLRIAERCFAALGDVAMVQAIARIHDLAAQARAGNAGATDGYDHFTVRAELFILAKEFTAAERVYRENGKDEMAMRMWEEMGRFDASIAIAESCGLPDLAERRARYLNWLMETRQYEKAGAIREKEGRYLEAIDLYLRGGTPARAANVVSAYDLRPEQQLLEAIAAALSKAQIFEKAGAFFEKLRMDDRAMDAYKRGHVFGPALELARQKHPEKVVPLEEEWGDYLVSQKHVDQAINHYIEAGTYGKAVRAAINSRQWRKAVSILESQDTAADGGAGDDEGEEAEDKRLGTGSLTDANTRGFYRVIAQHYEETHQYAEAEKLYVRTGAVNEAVEMYNRAGMSDHMYRVAQRHLGQQQLIDLFIGQAKQLEAKGDYTGAERVYLKVNDPDQAIVMYKKLRDTTNMIRLVQAYRPDFLFKTHLSLAAQFEKESNLKMAETHYVAGKDWGRAVNMYRDRDMWEDAVRVAKIHGGANAARQLVILRALVMDVDEGLKLLSKFNLTEAGIEAALETHKFDLALQWAQAVQPSKLPFVYFKYAMYYEDQGDFRVAEETFIKSGKPREAIEMYVHQHEFSNAMRVAEQYDQSSIPSICATSGRVCFQQGNYKEAEQLFLRAKAPETLLKMYMDHRMYTEAQRIAKEHCPEALREVAKRIALQSNDPQKAGAVLEENREYQLAIDAYLSANPETVQDPTVLANLWVRAVKVAQRHARNALRDTLRVVTEKLKAANHFVEAGKCLEDCEDYKGAINMYVQGQKFEMAEALARRISPEMVDYVKRAIVQDSIDVGGGMRDAHLVEDIHPEAALKAYIAKGDFTNAMRLVKQRMSDQLPYVAGLQMQHFVKQGDVLSALQTVNAYPLDTEDFRFHDSWLRLAQMIIPMLDYHGEIVKPPEGKNAKDTEEEGNIRLATLHERLVKVNQSITASGQEAQEVARVNALVHIIHIYHVAKQMRAESQLQELSIKLMLGLPRWIPFISPEKAFYDAGMACKEGGMEGLAFLYLNYALDFVEAVEDQLEDSAAIANDDFALAVDIPKKFPLPSTLVVSSAAIEEAKNWVLLVSIEVNDEKQRQRVLPTVQDPQSGKMMFEGSLKSPSGNVFPECAVSGYPIISGGLTRCAGCQRAANQADWNRFVMVMRHCPWCGHEVRPDFRL